MLERDYAYIRRVGNHCYDSCKKQGVNIPSKSMILREDIQSRLNLLPGQSCLAIRTTVRARISVLELCIPVRREDLFANLYFPSVEFRSIAYSI